MRSVDSMPHLGGWCKEGECIRLPECKRNEWGWMAWTDHAFWCVDCEWCRAHQPIPFQVSPPEAAVSRTDG
jgi:hypothetical protein